MTDNERAEMTERLAKIGKSDNWEANVCDVHEPYFHRGCMSFHVIAECHDEHIAKFIAHAPDDMRNLLAENAELRRDNREWLESDADIRASTLAEVRELCEAKSARIKLTAQVHCDPSRRLEYLSCATVLLDFARELGEMK